MTFAQKIFSEGPEFSIDNDDLEVIGTIEQSFN